MEKDVMFMKEALIEATKAFELDESPIGAIIVYKDQILQLEEPLNSVDEMGKQRSYYLRFKIYRKTSKTR